MGKRAAMPAALLALTACLGAAPTSAGPMDADGGAPLPDASVPGAQEGGVPLDASVGNTPDAATAPDASVTNAQDAGANADATPGRAADAGDAAGSDAAPPPAGVGSPAALVFVTQPTNVTVGAQEPTIQVAVVDAAGHTVTAANSGVVLSLGGNPANVGFFGKPSADAVAGIASFPSLGITAPGTGYTLVASPAVAGLTPATSQSFNVTPPPFSLVDLGVYGGNITSVAAGTTADASGSHPIAYSVTPGGVYTSSNNGGSWSAASFGTAINFGTAVSSGAKLVVDPTNGATAYLSALQALLKTTNAGHYWLPIGAADAACFVVDPSHPQNLYTGTHRSTDGGNTWSTHGLALTCRGMAIDPNTSALYATVSDSTSAYVTAIYKSVDTGTTWTPTASLALDAAAFTISGIFATASGVFVADANSLQRSTDGGATWTQVAAFTAVALAAAPSNPLRVYVATNNLTNGLVAVSNDGGATFGAPVSVGDSTALGGGSVASLSVDPLDADRVYAATPTGVFASIDAGATWSAESTGIPYPAVLSAALNRANPAMVYIGLQSSLLVTSNSGQTWSPAPVSGQVAASIPPATPNTIYACSGQTLNVSSDGGGTWGAPLTVPGCGFPVFASGQTLAMPFATGVDVSMNGGATWMLQSSIQGVYSAAFDPSGLNVYAGTSKGTYQSTDGGNTWLPMVATDYATAMLVDPLTPTTVYAGLGCAVMSATGAPSSGGVKRSTDSGATWTAATGGVFCTKGMLGLASGTLFAYSASTFAGGVGVMKSTDRAMTWTPLGVHSTNAIAVSSDAMTIYAATPAGLYKSTTGGI